MMCLMSNKVHSRLERKIHVRDYRTPDVKKTLIFMMYVRKQRRANFNGKHKGVKNNDENGKQYL